MAQTGRALEVYYDQSARGEAWNAGRKLTSGEGYLWDQLVAPEWRLGTGRIVSPFDLAALPIKTTAYELVRHWK
jgi:hypothetical protein